jgi:hypothetical protein
MDPLATVPPQGSGRGQGPGWHTLLQEEMEFADLATAPPGGFMTGLARSPSEPEMWKTQLPEFWGLPREGTAGRDVEQFEGVRPKYRTRGNSTETERGDGSTRTGKVIDTAEAAAQARPARWCRAGKGGRFGSNDERKRFYFEKSVEVGRREVVEWTV